MLRVAAVAGLMVVAGLGAATTASAHSQLERTDPADGSTLTALPAEITLTFNQNVLGLGTVLQITGPGGNAVGGAPKVIDNQVHQPVRPGSPGGAYTVLWRVTSADGHPISGRFGFTATAGSAGAAQATASGAGNGAAASAGSAATAAGGTGSGATSEGSGSSSGEAVLWGLVGMVAVIVMAFGIALAFHRRASRTVPEPAVPEPAVPDHTSP
jgi:methionine-rich copper-binding protein CopC